jgi:2'-hydroxyisoflavone reductase
MGDDCRMKLDDCRMKLLVLGGSWFLGRAVAAEALGRGHEVTTFNRGKTGRDLPGVEPARGDRANPDDLARLVAGRAWDAVVDTSGEIPRVVGAAAAALAGRAGSYAFISTVSAYTGWPEEPLTEDSETYPCPPDAGPDAKRPTGRSPSGYGVVKAGAERAVHQAFDGQVLIVRPGVVLGPDEYVGRLPWWVGRAARGGPMPAPGDPAQPIQPIDVRDVAIFVLDRLEQAIGGTFNLAAPIGHATMGDFIGACVQVTGGHAEPVWVPDRFLVEAELRAWTEVPLWRPAPGPWQLDVHRSLAARPACRPIQKTVADTWAWLTAGRGPVAHARAELHGLDPDKEQRLLAAWAGQPA